MHAQALLQRIRDEGHTIGSHTVDHISLDNLDTTRIEYELGGLESTLGDIGIPAPRVGPCEHASQSLSLDTMPCTAQGRRTVPADDRTSLSAGVLDDMCKCLLCRQVNS